MIRKVGDPRDVVVEISLDFDGFEWLVNELESPRFEDGFVKELRAELESIRSEVGR